MPVRRFLAAAGLATGACGGDLPVRPFSALVGEVAVAANSVVPTPGAAWATAHLTVRNDGAREVFLPGCGAIAVPPDYASGDVWKEATTRGVICLATVTTLSQPLAPGEVVRDSLRVVRGPYLYRVRVRYVRSGATYSDRRAAASAAFRAP